jgi:putative transposase
MVRFQFRIGLRFFEGTKRWALEKINARGLYVFESQDEQCERVSKTLQTVHADWLRGHWVIDADSLGPSADHVWHTTPSDLSGLPPQKRKRAEERLKIVMAVKSHFNSIGKPVECVPESLIEVAKKKCDELKIKPVPHWTTVWRWWRYFAPTGSIAKLADAHRLGRPLNEKQYAVFEEAVNEVYLTEQKNPKKSVWDKVETRYGELNRDVPTEKQQQMPSRATVYRWLDKLHYSVVSTARDGRDFNRRERREVTGTLKCRKILERYEVDHTPVDVLVVCEKTWMVLGRPWLTFVIDRHSRMIAGYYLGFNAPSASSVMYAMRMALLPKDEILAAFPNLTSPWPVRGRPMTLALDNGMDLHSRAVESFCLEMLIELHFMGVARPEMKGAVERLFGTVSRDLFHTLPGSVFSSVDERGDYPAEKRAALTLKTFNEILLKWIVDVYHMTPHRGLKGYTPLQVWQAGEAQAEIELPAYPRQLDLMVGHMAERALHHYGIDYENIRYSSTQLLALRDTVAAVPRVMLKAYEDDVGHIDVKDHQTGEFLRVPAIDQDYAAGMNRRVHDLIHRQVVRRFGDKHMREHLLEMKAEIQSMVKLAVCAKKTGTRKKAAALRSINSEANLGRRPEEALSSAHDSVQEPIEPMIGLHETADDELPDFRVVSVEGSTDAK